LVTISIDPGATEAGTVYLKSLMVMTAAADAEGVAAAEVLDVAEEVWALDVVGAVLEDVPAEVEDVAAGADGLLFDPLQAPSARVAPRAQTAIVVRRMVGWVMVAPGWSAAWGGHGLGVPNSQLAWVRWAKTMTLSR